MILTVGAILNRRPLPTLARAAGRLRHRWPELTLHVVGENRTRPPLDLNRVVDDAGMTGRVRLDGFVDDAALALRYAAADVAVFLSDYEGFGLPALEAMARGVPVVASRAPSLGEIFGEAALLVEPRDELAVADAIDRDPRRSGPARRPGAPGPRPRGPVLLEGHRGADVAVPGLGGAARERGPWSRWSWSRTTRGSGCSRAWPPWRRVCRCRTK